MRTLYFALWFLFSFFFSSPNLSRRRLDVCHTSTHGVVLVWISDAGLKRATGGWLKYRTRKLAKKSPYGYRRTTLSSYIFAIKTRIDNRQNLSSNTPHNMVNFGPLAAEIDPVVWGIPANFNGFRVLAALLHDTPVLGVGQTAALNRGRHRYSIGLAIMLGTWPTF